MNKKNRNIFKWVSMVLAAFFVTNLGGSVSEALNLPNGATQVGTINNAPVVKSPTDNMASQEFQDIIAALLEGGESPEYIINQASWGSTTSLYNGVPLSSISSTATAIFGADGFLPSDHALELAIGQTAYVQNVGTAIKTADGSTIPISLAVTVNSAVEPDGTPLETVVLGAKSQSSVITLAWGSIVRGGVDVGGGQTEGGGIGGGSSDGTLMAFIESVSYTLTFINSDTGKPLPNNTLMPIKNSDIDAFQLAEMDSNGVKGYIISPDTALTQSGNGFKSSSNGAINEDSADLTENSYLVAKYYNSNWVQYGYTEGAHNHMDIVCGHFGKMPFNISELLGGYLEIDKATFEYEKEAWNSNYSFEGLLFDVVDKDGKVVDTITLDKKGTGKSKRVPQGDYTLVERSGNWKITGQTVRANEKTKVKNGDTTKVTLKNNVVVGENTLQKLDKDTNKEKHGKADLTTAKYQLFYNDDSKGSSAHKKGDAVKWTDTPNPKLLKGTKATSAIVGGQEVSFGDQVVIDVDDESLQAAVGNLPLGKYYWVEVDAGEGYVVDATKHEFTISYKDEKTSNVIAEEKMSMEQVIDAQLKINKQVTMPDNQGGSGYNGIEFTAYPLEGTAGEPIVMETGVDPVTGDDGYALASLPYGDYKVSETSELEGYKNIQDFYIHMETDLETDVLTISASYNADYSKPFSIRKYALQDSSNEKNPNSQGTVGSVKSDKPTISLSTIHINNNPEEELPPVAPMPPVKDVAKELLDESINEGNVALNSDFYYVLKTSVLQPGRAAIKSWEIVDPYNTDYDRYNGQFTVFATNDFGDFKTGDEIPQEYFSDNHKEGELNYTVEQALIELVNANKDKEVGFVVYASFYRHTPSDEVTNTFYDVIDEVKQESNEVWTKTPAPEPHKFDLAEAEYDLTGDKLLDDDSEMDDRYKDSNDDPYNDKTTNNEKENINNKEVAPGQLLHYQLWLDTRCFDETSKLKSLNMIDDYDETGVTPDLDNVHVFNSAGEEVTEWFSIEDKDGQLIISANAFKESVDSKGEKIQIVDTEKIPFGQYYKIELPMVVKDDVKAGYDIINVASQNWIEADGAEESHITEKRVNKTPEAEKTPTEKIVEKVIETILPNTGTKKAIYLTVIGLALVGVVAFVKRDELSELLKKVKKK